MSAVKFTAPGIARPKGSKRLARLKNGHTVMLEMSKHERPWREQVAFAAAQAMKGRERFTGRPLSAFMAFGFPRPKSHYGRSGLKPGAPRWHVGRPDASKLARSVEDALNGIVWDDDSRVARLVAHKYYLDRDELAGVNIEVQELREDMQDAWDAYDRNEEKL